MPGLPPNSRSEKIQDYANQCVGIPWREERVRAADGKDLALCVADVHLGNPHKNQKPVSVYYILYFQGNAASIPPRLPDLSSTLAMLKRDLSDQPSPVRLTFACLSYRGYWTSKGRPSERGIRLDSVASLDWISRQHEATTGTAIAASDPPATRSAKVILWGQSIGSGVATNLAAEYAMPTNLRLDSIILETPFTNLRAMLEVLYPQKWLPYKYLWPFLRNQLDSWKNMGMIYEKYRNTDKLPNIFILEAAKDELVPASLSQELYDRVVEVGLPVDKKAVPGAFHNDTMFRVAGRKAVSEFIAGRINKRV
ncbi:Alpha/Beta hydrolase protein [Truncatella angustata]|uniref:Alpha/Beta hydrolase protein n=1 Tax=Truncatella angustata TaxID=152316 RepID=A0A9P9A1L3_9PEZI|nr:Alpha/Beta hydrolase protein [Truncatella angustata]KAH6657276.1 Alpha/Beta hydrolase protein [Truncatella angustata]